MLVGQTVYVRVNGGRLTRCQVIDLYDGIVVVAGDEELSAATAQGRDPLGVGFPVSEVFTAEEAKLPLTIYLNASIM